MHAAPTVPIIALRRPDRSHACAWSDFPPEDGTTHSPSGASATLGDNHGRRSPKNAPQQRMARLSLIFFLAIAGASVDPAAAAQHTFMLTSPAFAPHSAVPLRFTCNGKGISPPLQWRSPPRGTRSYALTVTDPDAPDPAHPTHTFVHWVISTLPVGIQALPAGASKSMPPGTRKGRNSAGGNGYVPLCPPVGRHRYFFRLYALDTVLTLPSTTDRVGLLAAMKGHVLARAVLVGTYAHPR